jgi:hypothetical protein
MKFVISTVALLLTAAAVLAGELKHIGSEPDYVLSALPSQIDGSTISSNVMHPPGLLYGGYIFVPAKRDWDSIVTDLSARIYQLVAADGWTVDSNGANHPTAIPSKISVLASKGNEYLEIVVWMFPVQGAKVGVSYTQGKK